MISTSRGVRQRCLVAIAITFFDQVFFDERFSTDFSTKLVAIVITCTVWFLCCRILAIVRRTMTRLSCINYKITMVSLDCIPHDPEIKLGKYRKQLIDHAAVLNRINIKDPDYAEANEAAEPRDRLPPPAG